MRGLGQLPSWAAPRQTAWAPDVHQVGKNAYIMCFSLKTRAEGPDGKHPQAIGYATANSPSGPWTFASKPLIAEQDPALSKTAVGGAIDPSWFTDGGKTYIAFKNDGNSQQPKRQDTLFIQQVSVVPGKGGSPPTVKREGTPIAALKNPVAPGRPGTNVAAKARPDVGVTIEAPQVIVHRTQDGKKEYVMFYSTGAYNNHTYTEWYATATSLDGPWTSGKLLESGGEAGGRRKLNGPGGATVRGNIIVFHNISSKAGKPLERQMMVAKLQWREEGAIEVPYVAGGLPREGASS